MASESKAGESFREKVRRLRGDLVARGEDVSFAAPPAWRLAWRLGWRWTPPLFRGFWTNALTLGAAWGLTMLLIAWIALPYISRPLDAAGIVLTLLGGACFGLLLAGLLRLQSKRLRLPPWNEY